MNNNNVKNEMFTLISRMSAFELLDYIVENPTDLTDPYYYEYRVAINNRVEELRDEQTAT